MPESVIVNFYKSNNVPDVFLLNHYVLTGTPVFIQIQNPYYNIDDNSILQGYEVSYYTVNIGNQTFTVQGNELTGIILPIQEAGEHLINISTYYENGKSSSHIVPQTITILSAWPQYDFTKTRVLSINDFELNYSLEQVQISPNEFGIADVFNASILKLNSCVQFLRNYSTVISNRTPTRLIGWLGIHKLYPGHALRWYTCSNTPNLSRDYDQYDTEDTSIGFNNILAFKVYRDELYVVDKSVDNVISIKLGSLTRKYENLLIANNLTFLSQIKNIISIEVTEINETIRSVYLLDNFSNKLFKMTLFLSPKYTVNKIILEIAITGILDNTAGSFGDKDLTSKFYSPTHLHFKDDCVYVTDFNNFSIKKFTANLGWLYTFYLEEFVNNPPISTAVTSNKHKMSAGLVYILTETNRVYILNQQGIVYNENTPYIHLLHTNLIPKHIIFDNSEEFFYIIYDSLVAKYSMLGLYINTVEGIPTDSKFICASQDIYHNIYVADSKRIFKFVDVVQDFSIVNENYDSLYWSEDEIIIKEEEFVQDWVYNRCLKRVAHNVDNYRKSIHSRFGINTVYYPTEVITYYTAIPIPEAETSLCSNLIHEVGVGANEFTITQVLNRDIEKIYNCIFSLKYLVKASFLTDAEGQNLCEDGFAWAWRDTKCQGIKMPIIKTCNINPISYVELKSDFVDQSYVPGSRWIDAFGKNCTGLMPSPSPTRTATPTPSVTYTQTPTITRTPFPSRTSSLTPTPTPTISLTYTLSVTPTISETTTQTPTPTPTVTITLSETATPTPTPTFTPTTTRTEPPGGLGVPTQTPTSSETPTPTPTITPTITPSESMTPTPTLTPTVTPTPTSTEWCIKGPPEEDEKVLYLSPFTTYVWNVRTGVITKSDPASRDGIIY